MAGIRTITYNITKDCLDSELDKIRKASSLWANMYSNIHTQRITACPFSKGDFAETVQKLNTFCDTSDIRWFNIPVEPSNKSSDDKLFAQAEELIRNNSRCFINFLAVKDGVIYGDTVKRCIASIRNVASFSHNGKDNFRLGCSINVKPNGAFFPFTYSGGELGFSIGLELVEDINEVCQQNKNASFMELRELIIERLQPQIEAVYKNANDIAGKVGIEFFGIDFSIAPVISKNGSVLNALTRLGVYNFGATGTLFATSFLTDVLKSFGKHFPTVGFSGVMYSVLEDIGICMINKEKGICLDDLIKSSTMCGCGVDMVPVPFDITDGEMISIFMDVFAISTRLQKPLGIRILPIPQVSRMYTRYTNFSDDADFIANTKVMNLDGNVLYEYSNYFSYLM